MPDIEIYRGYEVLPDNNIRFGIRVINNRDSVISDVKVLLDYSEDSFKLQGDKIQKLGTIPPSVPRTAKFILQPRGCIHKEELGATVLYKDHEWNRQTVTIRPKEVHCVCPFLKEKSMSRAEFLSLLKSGYSAESGVNFENIGSGRVVELLSHTCKNRLYKVDEFSVDGGTIIYLAGDAVGEKAYYQLTAVVKEQEGLTQVFLRANSDKAHGLTGFLNETLDNLRHLVVSGKVREIGVIKKEQVINIIDSVVQRTTFGGEGATSVNIKGSVVQRTDFKADDERKQREEERLNRKEEERLQKEEEEQERTAREATEREQKAREGREKQAKLESERREQERLRKQKEVQDRITAEPLVKEKKPLTKYLVFGLVLSMLVVGYGFMNSGSIQTQIETDDFENGNLNTTFTQSSSTNEQKVTPTQVSTEGIEVPNIARLQSYQILPAGGMEINVGDIITFRNFDTLKRQFVLISEDNLWEENPSLNYMRTVNYTFTEAGTYTFYVQPADTNIWTVTVV